METLDCLFCKAIILPYSSFGARKETKFNSEMLIKKKRKKNAKMINKKHQQNDTEKIND